MKEIHIIEEVYRETDQPIADLQNLTDALAIWFQTFSEHNYLQPCVINGKASIICERQLSSQAPHAFRALKVICAHHGIFLKEDARTPGTDAQYAHCRRRMAVVLTFCIGMMAVSQSAAAKGKTLDNTNPAQQSQRHSVTQTSNRQTLSMLTQSISAKTGIQFKFNAAVGDDVIDNIPNTGVLNSTLSLILDAYNYTVTQDGKTIKTIFITGYKGGVKPVNEEAASINAAVEAETTDSTHDGFQQTELQDKILYDVQIPTEELVELPVGSELTVDLPIGSFNIKQENMVDSEDGTLSWVGTMEGQNSIYRLYLAKTQEGDVVGNAYTPNGAYTIETVDGQTVMLEIDQIDMH